MNFIERIINDFIMSLPRQKAGVINNYKPEIDLGTQPIRVISPMLVYMFQNTNPAFFEDLLLQIKHEKLNKQLGFTYGEEPIMIDKNNLRTPRINIKTKTIELPETFLSYLWCCIYAVYVKYIETIDFPRVNRFHGKIKHPITQKNIDESVMVFDYAKYLIVDFKEWDKTQLPNPEIYTADAMNRDYIEQTNCYYTDAVKFILCHEFTHLKKHVEQINDETTVPQFLEFELDADNNAIDMMKGGINFITQISIENGIIFGLLSMFFISAKTTGKKHPNVEDRLTNALERLDLSDDTTWGIACVGLQMWDEQFGHKFNWSENIVSYKQQYYEIIKQIKERNR